MRSRRGLDGAALDLARCQEAVLSRAQLRGLGMSDRSIDGLTGDWVRLARGIYLVGPAVGEPPWLARVWAGLLLGGAGARAAGLTAAVLDDLASLGEDLNGRRTDRRGGGSPATTQPIRIVGPGKIGPHEGFEFVRERPGTRLASMAREPARTRVEDTTLDLCAEGRPADVVTWLTRACQRRLTTPERLRRRAADRPTLRHRRIVLEVLDDVELGATSNLEHQALREVITPHALPIARLQHRIGSSGRIADGAVEAYQVLIEFDGRLGHVEEGAFRDRRRDNDHTLSGWVTLRFGWFDVVENPCAVAAQIAELLVRRGWPGSPAACPRCAGSSRC